MAAEPSVFPAETSTGSTVGKVLAVDLGGRHVKIRMRGKERRRADSGPTMTPQQMVDAVVALAAGWAYEVISLGVPAPIHGNKPDVDPVHLGPGWAGFDFEAAFGKPTKVVNDAAMQALGSYEGGRMLFLGLGTGLGTALVLDGVVYPMEGGRLPFKNGKTVEECVGAAGMLRSGHKRWLANVRAVTAMFATVLQVDEVVLGGGNAKLIDKLPPRCRLGANANAFEGGFRLWEKNAPAVIADGTLQVIKSAG